MSVYRVAPPPAAGPLSAVIVLQEAFGVNDHIQDVTRRVAAEGYLTLAPDLFHRGAATVDYAVADITGPVLMMVGDQDPTIPAEHISAVRQACSQAGTSLRVRIFPGAGHAFHCDARPALYRADAARQVWREAVAFLAETAGSPPAHGDAT
jgi:carboxymethylenebutenolidase